MVRHQPTARTDGYGNKIYETNDGSEHVVRNWTTNKKGAITGRIYTPIEQSYERYKNDPNPAIQKINREREDLQLARIKRAQEDKRYLEEEKEKSVQRQQMRRGFFPTPKRNTLTRNPFAMKLWR